MLSVTAGRAWPAVHFGGSFLPGTQRKTQRWAVSVRKRVGSFLRVTDK